jgi:membrane associated rhomboid family serine protease
MKDVARLVVLMRGYFRCGEFIVGVCSLSAIVLGIAMAAVVVAFGFGMVLGPVLAASRKRKAISADV